MFTTFVTISGEFPDSHWDYVDICAEFEFETLDEAIRCYECLHVKRWGAIAYSLHALFPELTQIEAEYSIYEDNCPIGDDEWFVNEAIWWKED